MRADSERNCADLSATDAREPPPADARGIENELRDVIETISTTVWTASPDGRCTFVNRPWTEYTGLPLEDTIGRGWLTPVHTEDVERHLSKWRDFLVTGQPFEDEVRFLRAADGQYRWFWIRGVPMRDEHGTIVKWCGTFTDIEDRKQAEALVAAEKRLLVMIATGVGLEGILNALCLMIEEQRSASLASVLLLNPDGLHLDFVAGPTLPSEWAQQIRRLPIGPCAGSCGTAAYRRSPVIVSDIATDPLWEAYCASALQHGLRASWSSPVLSSDGKLLGTFCMYYREPRSPIPRDLELIELATHIVRVAIERDRAGEALRESEEKWRAVFEHNPTMYFLVDAAGTVLSVNPFGAEQLGYTVEEQTGASVLNVFHEADRAAVQRNAARCLEQLGQPLTWELRKVRKDGSICGSAKRPERC